MKERVVLLTVVVLLPAITGVVAWWGGNWFATGSVDVCFAAGTGDLDALQWVARFRRRRLVQACGHEGVTPLHLAPDAATADLLVTMGADVNQRTKDGASPLHYAAAYGHGDVTTFLLTHGAAVGATSAEGGTPLHCARSAEVARILLKAGAAVTAQEHQGRTPLHCAVARRDAPVIAVLLDAGADPNVRDRDGNTPLRVLADPDEEPFCRQVAHWGIEMSAREGRSVIRINSVPACSRGVVAELLLRRGASPDIKDAAGRTALQAALQAGQADLVKVLRAHAAAEPPGPTKGVE